MATVTSLKFDITSGWSGDGVDDASAQLAQLKAQIDDLNSQKIQISADTAQVNAQIAQVKQQIDDIKGQVGVTIDDATAIAEIDQLKEELAGLNSQKIALNVDKTQADADIAALKVELDSISNKTVKITSDSSAARADIDSAAEDMESHLEATSSSWDNLKASGNAASFSLVTALAAIGIALAPLGGGLLALGGSMISAFGGAALAAAPFAGIVLETVKGALTMNTNLGKLNGTLSAQEAQLKTLTPGTAAYKAQLDAISQTQSQISQTWSGASSSIAMTATALQGLTQGWQKLTAAMAPVIEPLILNVILGLEGAMKALAPLIEAVAAAFAPLVKQFDDFTVQQRGDMVTSGSGIVGLVNWLIDFGVPDLKMFIQIIMNIGTTIVQVASAFSSEGEGMLATIVKVTSNLDEWGANGGFSRFAESVRAELPQIETFFKGLGVAIQNVFESINAMGPSSLTVLGVMLGLIGKLPIGVIQAFILAFAAYKTIAAAATAFFAVETAVNAVKVAMTAAREVVLGFSAAEAVAADDSIALKIGMIAQSVAVYIAGAAVTAYSAAEVIADALGIPMIAMIGLIVIAVAAVGFAIYELVDHWTTVWNTIKSVAEDVWNALKVAFDAVVKFIEQNWQYLILALGPLGWLIDIGTHWSTVWNGIKTAATVVWDALKTAWTDFINAMKTAWDSVSSAISGAWSGFWNALKNAAMVVWDALKTAWNDEVNGWKEIWDTVSSALSNAWNAFWNAIKTAAEVVWDALKTAWNDEVNGWKEIWDTVSAALSAAWDAVWDAIKTAATTVWDALQTAWSTFVNGIEAIYQTVSSALESAWQAFWGAIQTAATTVWDALQTAWNTFLNLVESVYDTVSSAIQTAWNEFWTVVQTVATTIWDALQTAWNAFLNLVESVYDTISAAIQTAWSEFWNTVETVATTIWDAIQTAWNTFLDLIKSTYDTISAAIQEAWGVFWDAVKSAATAVWDALQTAWSDFLNAIKSAYDTISSAITTAWNATWSTLKAALTSFVSDATSVWKGLQTAFEAPIHFVIDTVLNHGIIAAINWVIGALGGSKTAIGLIPLPFAEGGHVRGPGSGTSDSIPAMVSNGEYIMPAAQTAAIGVHNFEHMRSTGSLPHYATGGIVTASSGSGGSDANATATGVDAGGLTTADLTNLFTGLLKTVGGAAAGVAGDVAGAAGDAASAVAGAAKDVQNANIPVVSSIAGLLGGGASAASTAADAIAAGLLSWGQSEFDQGTDAVINLISTKLIPGIPAGTPVFGAMAHGAASGEAKQALTNMRDDISKFLFGQEQKQVASEVVAGVIPTGSQKALIDSALAADGIAATQWPAWEAGLNTLITRESNWNASAINNYDSNAAAGTPSEGLAQVIAPTFAAYRNPSLPNNLLDPVANIAAAVNYINKVYGGIGNVQQANASLPPKGYDTGGPLPMGLTMVNNTTGTMEGVLNPTGLAAIGGLNALAALNSGSTGNSYQSGNYSYSGSSGSGSGRGSGNLELNVTVIVPTTTSADPQEVVDAVTEQLIPELTVLLKQHAGG